MSPVNEQGACQQTVGENVVQSRTAKEGPGTGDDQGPGTEGPGTRDR